MDVPQNALQKLRPPAIRRVRVVEGVGQADAVEWLLLYAVHDAGGGEAGGFEEGGRDVDDVVELRSQSAVVSDAARHSLLAFGPPNSSIFDSTTCTSSRRPFIETISLNTPSFPPAAAAPLSPMM